MNQLKVRNYLETATNLAILLVAALVIGTYAASYIAKRYDRQPEGLHKGKMLQPILGQDYANASRTLLIALNPQCGYCHESIPFYREIIRARGTSSQSIRIIAVSQIPPPDMKQYLQEKHLDVDAVAEVNFPNLNIQATPTMILVDNNGNVLDFWIGKLSTDDEQQVLRTTD